MEIFRKGELWFASITFLTERPFRESGTEAIGMDWGTSRFMTIVIVPEKEGIQSGRSWYCICGSTHPDAKAKPDMCEVPLQNEEAII